ncbi:prephenate dehydrogenase [bacterium]|nr:prephenate dehydrogenase [bacterium]
MAAFRQAAIIGVGLIGGSLGIALKKKMPGIRIIGVSSKKTIEDAESAGVIDRGYVREDLENALPGSDILFICTPISDIINRLPRIIRAAEPGALITDAGSTKRKIVEAADRHSRPDVFFIGGHPMAGSEGRGVANADPLLFENAVWVLTPSGPVPQEKIQSLGNLIETLGAKVLFLSPALHDRMAAAVSHLPQLLAVTLVNWVGAHKKNPELFLRLAAGGFRDMTRIASSPYDIWKDIIATNRDEIAGVLEEFGAAMHVTLSMLDTPKLEGHFRDAARRRLSIPRDTKGFLRPHFDLQVRVEDKPGVIASIATTLAGESINIKDIEVLKVREGDSGTIRLSLETEEARLKAKALLESSGFSIKI